MISAIENGQRNPTVPTIYRIAHALKVEISDLYELN